MNYQGFKLNTLYFLDLPLNFFMVYFIICMYVCMLYTNEGSTENVLAWSKSDFKIDYNVWSFVPILGSEPDRQLYSTSSNYNLL